MCGRPGPEILRTQANAKGPVMNVYVSFRRSGRAPRRSLAPNALGVLALAAGLVAAPAPASAAINPFAVNDPAAGVSQATAGCRSTHTPDPHHVHRKHS